MSMKSMKLWTATVIVTCGLGLGVGSGWLAPAQGQAPQRETTKTDPQADLKRLQHAEKAARANQDRLLNDYGAAFRAWSQQKGATVTAKTSKWEYDFVVISDLGVTKFVEFLQVRENHGWEFNGQTTLSHNGKPTGMWTFRRPAQRTTAQATPKYDKGASDSDKPYDQLVREYFRYVGDKALAATPDDAKSLEAEITRLQARLHALTKTGKTEFTRDALPLEPVEFAEVLKKMVQKRFPGKSVTFTSSSTGIVVEGDPQVRQWLAIMMKKLSEQ